MTKSELKQKIEKLAADCYGIESLLPSWKTHESQLSKTRYQLFLVRVDIGHIIQFVQNELRDVMVKNKKTKEVEVKIKGVIDSVRRAWSS